MKLTFQITLGIIFAFLLILGTIYLYSFVTQEIRIKEAELQLKINEVDGIRKEKIELQKQLNKKIERYERLIVGAKSIYNEKEFNRDFYKQFKPINECVNPRNANKLIQCVSYKSKAKELFKVNYYQSKGI